MEGQQVAEKLSKKFGMSPRESSVFLVAFAKKDGSLGSGVDGEQEHMVYVYHEDNGADGVTNSDSGSASGWRCLWAHPRVHRDLSNGSALVGAKCITSDILKRPGGIQNAHISDPQEHAIILQMFLPHSDDLCLQAAGPHSLPQTPHDPTPEDTTDYSAVIPRPSSEDGENGVFMPSDRPAGSLAPEPADSGFPNMVPGQHYTQPQPNSYYHPIQDHYIEDNPFEDQTFKDEPFEDHPIEDHPNEEAYLPGDVSETSQSADTDTSLKRKASTDDGEENHSEDSSSHPPSKKGSRKAASASSKAPKKRRVNKAPEPRQKKWIRDKIYASVDAFAANPDTHQEQLIPIKPLWHHLSAFLGKYDVAPEKRPTTDPARDKYVADMDPEIRKAFLQYEGEQRFYRDLRESKAQNSRWAFLTRYKFVAKRPTTGPNAPWTPVLSDYIPAPDS